MIVKKLEILLDCDETLYDNNLELLKVVVRFIENTTNCKTIFAELMDCKDTRIDK